MNYMEISSLNKSIGNAHILRDISLTINKGDIVGIVGPNGSGKTMLLRAIAGLLYIDSGYIKCCEPITKGVIIENPAFINEFTGIDNLRYLASIRKKITEKQIYQAMENVQLNPTDNRIVKKYSLGMKQRLAIAQAIMESPDLLILDEPTRGIDEEGVMLVRSMLSKMNISGTTIILSSHNTDDISSLCTMTYYIDMGMIRFGE